MADQTDHNLSVLRGLLDQVSGDVPAGLEIMARKALAELEQAANLRAPKGELAEARAELGAWLVEHPCSSWDRASVKLDGAERHLVGLRLDGDSEDDDYQGVGPTEAAAIRAALSRARGEGT
jgi:hypothetical protein